MGTGKRAKSKKKKNNSGGGSALKDSVVYLNPRGIPFPQRYRVILRCAIQGNIVAATSPAVYTVCGNSAYLPFSGGGWPGVIVASISTLQPCGYSNLCTSNGPYNNYRCFGSKIRARMIASAVTDMVTYTLTPGNTGTPPSSVSDALAEPRTKTAFTQGGSSMSQLVHEYDVTNFFGVGPYAVRDDLAVQFSANYNAQPAQRFNWYLAWTTSNGGTNGAAISYEVEMLFDVEFFNLNNGALLDN